MDFSPSFGFGEKILCLQVQSQGGQGAVSLALTAPF